MSDAVSVDMVDAWPQLVVLAAALVGFAWTVSFVIYQGGRLLGFAG